MRSFLFYFSLSGYFTFTLIFTVFLPDFTVIVTVVQSLQDIRILCISVAVGAAVQGILGISQFIGRDLFASEIGRNFLALGMDSSISRTIRFVYEGNSRSSVYMASYTPNYAGMYLVMVLPVLFV